MQKELSEKEKGLLFWASFLSLGAAGFGFAFRIAHMGSYGAEFGLTGAQVGNIAGSCFWPIAITMILFSLVVDKTGYKIPMFIAATLQIISGLGTCFANGYEALLGAAICAGLGHGIIEAVINPVCAAVYPKNKTKMLTILLIMLLDKSVEEGISWRIHALWIMIPAAIYALMYAPCKFPVDERVKAGVPFLDMLKQVGFLSMSVAAFMLIYKIGGEVLSDIFGFYELPSAKTWFFASLGGGILVGAIFGFIVKSVGKPLFFFLCLLMVPVATAELSTDNWIGQLMKPVLEDGWGVDARWAIIFSAGIMFLLRTFAGGILKFFSPPVLMAVSGILSASGLFWLGFNATGIAIFVAFIIYAVGQTYYWPCILGFVAERFPKGGALTLNTVSAMGLLSLGMIGNPILGVAQDQSIYNQSKEQAPELVETSTGKSPFLWMTNDVIAPSKLPDFGASKINGKAETLNNILTPLISKNEELKALKKEFDINLEKELKEARKKDPSATINPDTKAIRLYDLVDAFSSDNKEKSDNKTAIASALKNNIPSDIGSGIAEYKTMLNNHKEMKKQSGRDVLKFAAIFPTILVIAFGLIALYFRSIGGYKPVELEEGKSIN